MVGKVRRLPRIENIQRARVPVASAYSHPGPVSSSGVSAVVGVDLGGTNVRAGVYDESGTPLGSVVKDASRAKEGASRTMDAIASVVRQAIRNAPGVEVRSVGLAIPGHVDDHQGVVRWAPNFGEPVGDVLQIWKDVPVRAPLVERLNLPIHMVNDANAAALGEYQYGSGRGSAKCLVMLTLGTGIGGGVVMSPTSVGGKASGPLLLVGGNGGGAELGHICINYQGLDCNAGSYGSLEAYGQISSIVTRARYQFERGRQSLIKDFVLQDPSLGLDPTNDDWKTQIAPKHISQAADAGDEVAIEVYEDVATMVGVGIGTLINVFAPDVFAIGGGVAAAGDWILRPAIKSARKVAVNSLFVDCDIRIAEKDDDAGMLGAASFARTAVS
jgi:glucokinase